MAVATKKIRRPRAAGELAVEQTRDLASVIRMLTAAGMSAEGVETPGACYLIAHVGDEVAVSGSDAFNGADRVIVTH